MIGETAFQISLVEVDDCLTLFPIILQYLLLNRENASHLRQSLSVHQTCRFKASRTAVVFPGPRNRIHQYTICPLRYRPLERAKNVLMVVHSMKCGTFVRLSSLFLALSPTWLMRLRKPTVMNTGLISQANGSAYIECGNVKIACAVYVLKSFFSPASY